MKEIILYTVIIVLAFTLGYQLFKKPGVVETETTKVVQDTTTVDSLKREITYWRDIAEEDRDTIKVEVEIPVPTSLDSSLNRYRIPYSDSVLSALMELTVKGTIESKMDFSYTIKQEIVTEKISEYRSLRTIKMERIITRTIQPSAYLSAGMGVFVTPEKVFAIPNISYTTSGNQRYTFGYDPFNKAFYGSISVPINLPKIIPF